MSEHTAIKSESNTDQRDQADKQVRTMPLMTLQLPTRHLHSPALGSPMEPNSPLSIPLLSVTSTDRTTTMSPLDTKKNKNLAFRECSNCYTVDSPIWRKGPNDDKLCNKCGLYWSRHNKHRPIQITRTRVKKVDMSTLKQNRTGSPRPNSPRVNSPRINSPRINSPRMNSPIVSSPLTRVNSPLIAAASHVENSVGNSGKFAYEEDNSSNLMLLLEAVQKSNEPGKTELHPNSVSPILKQQDAPDERRILTLQDPGSAQAKRRRMMDINGSAFKAVVREIASENEGNRQNSPSGKPKIVSLVDRVLLM